ncbi:MAG: Hsp20/alpha crystallin family protein [Candidatus Acidiferrales bacterium]
MTHLTYRDNNVFQNLFDFRRDFDHIFNRFLTSGWQGGQEQQRGNMSLAAFAPAVDAFVDRTGRKFVAQVALPGVDPKDVEISAQGNMLTISGERNVSNERREADTVYNELIYGAFERTLSLPEGVDTQKITADYRNGVLEITAPISASALPRRIEITGGGQQKQMAAGTRG